MASELNVMEAAEALLELQCRKVPTLENHIKTNKTADKLSSDIIVDNSVKVTSISTFPSSHAIRSNPFNNGCKPIYTSTPRAHGQPDKSVKLLNLHQKHQQEQRRWQVEVKTVQMINETSEMTIKPSPCDQQVKKTRDIGTQTENNYGSAELKLVKVAMQGLFEKVVMFEKQLVVLDQIRVIDKTPECTLSPKKRRTNRSKTCSTTVSLSSDDSDDDAEYEPKESDESETTDFSYSDYQSSSDEQKQAKIYRTNTAITTDIVPIGKGNAIVPCRLLKQMDWTSYTTVTRKLLTAVFSRRVLATHSLTGKQSPAFPNKPAKKKLDPALVNDIVQTVVKRCKVPESVVRTSITTKCADESKMFRTRENKNRKNSQSSNSKKNRSHKESEDSSQSP